jgi:predicted NBD/HSP70 family sugar kinase
MYDPVETVSLPGRKPTPIRFNPDFACIIVICIEGFYASLGLLNAAGRSLLSRELQVPDVDLFIQNDFYREIDSLIASGGVECGRIIGIGMAMPAALDSLTRQVYRSPLLHSAWLANLEKLASELSSRYAAPVFVENDVNAAAYGEYRAVYSGITDSLVYLSLGSGLGGGIILNGKLWKGQNASAGEIGYMIFKKGGRAQADPERTAGGDSLESTGWLEAQTGLAALKEIFDFDIRNPRDPGKEARIKRYLSKHIALAILNINAVLDTRIVILGGILADYFSDSLAREVGKEIEKISAYGPRVIAGQLKNPSFAGLCHIIMDEVLDELLSR